MNEFLTKNAAIINAWESISFVLFVVFVVFVAAVSIGNVTFLEKPFPLAAALKEAISKFLASAS